MALAQSFSKLVSIFGPGQFFIVGHCPVDCKTFSSIPGLYF